MRNLLTHIQKVSPQKNKVFRSSMIVLTAWLGLVFLSYLYPEIEKLGQLETMVVTGMGTFLSAMALEVMKNAKN